MDMQKNKTMIPFSPPRIDKKIVDEVIDTLQSGWITTGPKTKQFEREIAGYCGIEKALAVNSWTAGAEMLLHWFGIGVGDEVIVPAYTYCATANIVVHCGATPIMVDINDDFCMNTEAVRGAITSKTKAIIPVDIAGLPIDYEALWQVIADKKDIFEPQNDIQKTLGRILVLADAAHSFGAVYKNKFIGNEADFTVFSFHAVKNLTTAEGGAICITMPSPFDNSALYNELNTLSLHGQNKDALAKTQKGAWEYDVCTAGYKCNMTDISAAMGLVELRRYNSETLPKRKAIIAYYNEKLSAYDWAILPLCKNNNRESAYHLYLLRIKDISLEQRNALIQKIFDKNVAVNVHYKPLPLLSFYKNMGYISSDYPNSNRFWETEISLPVYFDLTMKQIDIVVNALVESYYETIEL